MKVGVSKPPSASPVPGAIAELGGGQTMKRTGSGASGEPDDAQHIAALLKIVPIQQVRGPNPLSLHAEIRLSLKMPFPTVLVVRQHTLLCPP
jgi:hypothetical protein